VITESIPTDSSITESSLDKEQKKTKTQSRKKGKKSVKLSSIEEEILAIQQEISLNQEIASETHDVGKKKTKTQTRKKETKSAELAPIAEEIEGIQEEVNLTQEIPSEIEVKDLGKTKKTQAKKKGTKSVELLPIIEEIATIQEISPETVIPEPVPVIESQPAQAKKKKTKKATVSPENLVPENSPENPVSETPKTEEPEQKSPIFQAFGLVKGKILEQGSSYVLQIEDKTYPLFGSRGRIKSFVGSEEDLYLRVYPNWQPNTQKEEVLRNLSFTAVAILEKCPKNYPVNHFKVRGIWQRVPFLAEPVITIYRNQSRGAHDDCKALHFPLVWKDAPIEAFQYDSSLKGKQDYSKRFFCQVKVIFSPETEQFTVSGLLEEPTTDIPPYIKPKKSPKPPKVEKSSQPKPPIILKKKAEKSLETDLSSTLNVTPSKSSTLNVTPSNGSIG
jgi:hypothetical protein